MIDIESLFDEDTDDRPVLSEEEAWELFAQWTYGKFTVSAIKGVFQKDTLLTFPHFWWEVMLSPLRTEKNFLVLYSPILASENHLVLTTK